MLGKIFIMTIDAVFATACFAQAAELLPGGKRRVLGQYIVVLKSGGPADVARAHSVVPSHIYNHAIKGFAAALPGAVLKRLLDDPIEYFY